MNVKTLREEVNSWDATSIEEDAACTSKYGTILKQLEFLGSHEWANYVPATNESYSNDFLVRLSAWLGKVADPADRKLLLEYAQRISFFSQEDFQALHRSAFNGPITRWVIDECNLRFNSQNFLEELHKELNQHTWYCPVTDSMNINGFYHVNHITGVDNRPCFKDIEQLFPNPAAVKAHMSKSGYKRLVLLEDIVGSGSQAKDAIVWALLNLGVHVMFSPLIICPKGAELVRLLTKASRGALTYGPVIELSQRNMLGPRREESNSSEDGFSQKLEEFAKRSFCLVAGNPLPPPSDPPYTPFGFDETGSSIVTYTNTPDNTLPLIHHSPSSQTWSALFPRSSRI